MKNTKKIISIQELKKTITNQIEKKVILPSTKTNVLN